MSVKIIVDSSTDVSEEAIKRLTMVPLTIYFGEEAYIDKITIDHKIFYEKLVESDVLPTTSQPNPADFDEVFSKVVENGDSAVVLTLSSRLSGTYQSASIAAASYPDKIFVVDSKNVAIATGILAELALKFVDEGLSAKEIAERITTERENLCLIALLDTLEYLKKGGRISKTAAVAGGILGIKPVIDIKDGEVNVLGKARGSRQGNNLLVKEIENAGGVDFDKPVMLGYTGLHDALLKKYVEDSAFLWQQSSDSLRSVVIGSIIGTHAGPGAVAAAFFKKS